MENKFDSGVNYAFNSIKARSRMREKVHKAYIEYVGKGESPLVAQELCIERFEEEYLRLVEKPLTVRVVRNIIGRTPSSMDSLTEAHIIIQIQKAQVDRDDLSEELDRQLELLEGSDGWVDVETEETSKGQYPGVTIKRVPVAEARVRLLTKKVDLNNQFFDHIKALLPKTQVNVFTRQQDERDLDDRSLDERIKKHEKLYGALEVQCSEESP